MITKENLTAYINKVPDNELRVFTLFLVRSLNEQNLADLSQYFKIKMTFEPPKPSEIKTEPDPFIEALKKEAKKTTEHGR